MTAELPYHGRPCRRRTALGAAHPGSIGGTMRCKIWWHAGLAALAGLASAAAPDSERLSAFESITGAELLGHIKVLASDEFEGRAPGTPGEERTVAYLTEQFRKLGLKPGNPDGTYVQNVPLVGFQATSESGAFRVGGRGDRPEVPRRLGRRLAAAGAGGQGRELRRRLRRLRRRRARVRLGRLQGGRRPGQDARHAGQRPGRSRPERPEPARPHDVQGPGDDLLRPLDLQVRDRLREGRRRGDHRPRDWPRGLSLCGRLGELGPRELRHRAAPARSRGASRSKAGSPWKRPSSSVAACGHDFDALQGVGATPRFPPGAARRPGAVRDQERTPRGPVAQRHRPARRCRSEVEGRVRHLHRALGPPRPRPVAPGRPDL